MLSAQDTLFLKLSSQQFTLLLYFTQTFPLLVPATVQIKVMETTLHFLYSDTGDYTTLS